MPRLDLLTPFTTEDGWEILDHKADQIPPGGADQLVQRYADQLGAYSRAWAAVAEAQPTRVGINVVRQRQTVWFDH